MDRRNFLSHATLAALAPSLLPRHAPEKGTGDDIASGLRREGAAAGSAGLRRERLERIGIQLYTLRGEMQRDFEGTLQRLADIGYHEVEFAGYFGRAPADIRALLARHHLSAPSTHVPAETVEKDWARAVDDAAAIGCRYITAAWIDADRRRSLRDWRRWAVAFNRAAGQAQAAGLRFAYHNHNYEFAPVEGRVPWDVLLEQTSPDLVCFEMDLFWIISAGGDPLTQFARWPGRFPMVHVKDMDRAHRMVDVGRGSIDFRRILRHRAQAGIEHFFVEHDEPVSALDSARASYQYLRKLEF